MKPPEPPCLKASVDPLQRWGGGSVRLGIARIEGTGTEERREGAEARNARNERVGRRRGATLLLSCMRIKVAQQELRGDHFTTPAATAGLSSLLAEGLIR